MEKQTKNIITREWVEKELRFFNTARIKSTLVAVGIPSLLFLPFAFAVVRYFFTTYDKLWFEILMAVIFGGLLTLPTWICLSVILKCLSEKKMIDRGEFDVVKLELQYKSERRVRRSYEELLHFGGFKAESVGHTTYQLASAGDEFYIVHYSGNDEIVLLYSAKMYEYKEH